ncbi:MAG: 50S ribosomal protein L28 [Bdellovibrionales bacterium]
MAKCELSGKGPVAKNIVSHSNIKNKSIANPNVQSKRLFSDTLDRLVSLKVATSTMRTIEHVGGFDRYLVKADDSVLSKRAKTVKTQILRKLRSETKTKAAN